MGSALSGVHMKGAHLGEFRNLEINQPWEGQLLQGCHGPRCPSIRNTEPKKE